MTGDAMSPASMAWYWKVTATAAGIPKVEPRGWAITLHDLRHYYASGLIAAGCDVVTVQRALGHAKATTTLNTYSRMWPTAEDRTRAASASLLATVLAPVADSLRTAD